MAKPKMLYRSRKNRIIAGVCGGIGEYFGIDPTIIRVLWIFSVLFMGVGVLAYIILVFVVPEEPAGRFGRRTQPGLKLNKFQEKEGRFIGGVILVGVGIVLLMNAMGVLSWVVWAMYWPVIIILLGLLLLFAPGDKSK